MQGGRAFLRLHTRFQITEKELPYIVNHYLHCYNDCLPDPLRLFFGDGNGFFLCKHNAAQDPCREGNNKRAALVCKLLERYDRLLSTILIGNNIVNIATASIGTVLFVKHYGDAGATISTVVVTVVVLIFGEISPKSIAKDCAEQWAMLSAPMLQILSGSLRR